MGLYLFRFHHEVDLHRIMKDGHWNYDGRLLLLHELKAGEDPKTVPFNLIPFWVQVHNLLFDYFSEAIGRIVGNFAGKYLDYDPRISCKLWHINTCESRQNWTSVAHSNATKKFAFTVRSYERLQNFCYIYGIMGTPISTARSTFTSPQSRLCGSEMTPSDQPP
ncbi:hypothetical protein LINGRAPRIM_LOCUS2591 [Linum grandiflorum]